MNSEWAELEIEKVVERIETYDPRKRPAETFEYIDVSSVSRKTLSISDVAKLMGKEAPSRARRRVREGDVIFATIRPTLKRVAQVTPELDGAVCSTGFIPLRPKRGILSRYLFYWLLGSRFSEAMEKLQRGASYPAVSDSDVKAQIISIPSIPEQKRIVAILDEAFAGIETAVANTEKNLANAREIFESYLAESVVPTSSEIVRIGDCFETVTGNTPSKREAENYGDFLPFVKPPELRGGSIQMAADSISEAGAKKARIAPEGAVLVSCIGNLGKVAIAETPVAFNQQINAIFPKPDIMLPEFLLFQTLTKQFREQLHNVASGTTVSIVNKSKFNNLQLFVPTIEQQSEILDRLNNILHDTQALAALTQQKLARLGELKQSLLQKVFSGELTVDRAEREVESVAT